MTGSLRSGLIAGLIAAVIWMLITTAVGMGKTPVIAGGLLFLVGGALVTALITELIRRQVQRSA